MLKDKKRLVSLLLCLVLLLTLLPQAPVEASAGDILYQGTCGDDLRWTVGYDGTLTISGTGPMADYSLMEDGGFPTTPFSYCSHVITHVVIESGVTTIGAYAFYECRNMTDVTIPESVTIIGKYAFEGCINLKRVSIPKSRVTTIGEGAFCGCISLLSIRIPDGVTTIESYAFKDCTGLADVTFPASVTSIGKGAFYQCTYLFVINFMGYIPSIADDCFYGVYAWVFHRCKDKIWLDVTKKFGGYLTWYGHIYRFDSYHNPWKEATCTRNAHANGTCVDCGSPGTLPVPGTVTGHKFVNDTCTSCGVAADPICTHSNTKEQVISRATCMEKGQTMYTCTACGYVKYVTTAITDHSFENGICITCGGSGAELCQHQYALGVWTIQPTCITKGRKSYTCKICGYVKYASFPTTDHSFAEGICTVCGEVCRHDMVNGGCTVCGKACDHDYADGVWITHPTCTEDGQKSYTCNTCGYVEYDTVKASGHSLLTTQFAPSCTEDGYRLQECINCDYSLRDDVVPAPGHSIQTTQTAPSCTQSGQHLHQCVNCIYYFIDNMLPATGHNYENGICTICGRSEILELPGDINGDGQQSIVDVSILYAYTQGTGSIDADLLPFADVTGDGIVDIADTSRLYSHVKGTNPLT